MSPTNPWIPIGFAASLPGCHCERTVHQDTDVATITSTATSFETLATASTGTSEGGIGVPFDASRWIGRYHYEDVGLAFGERGEPFGEHMLANFEIFADMTAVMTYDLCAFDEPVSIAYEWTPDEPGWLELHPGPGESSLRMLAAENLESLRVHLVEPCRELEVEIEGIIDEWFPFHPGESCWFERCIAANIMRVDYCPGEEPPPCP